MNSNIVRTVRELEVIGIQFPSSPSLIKKVDLNIYLSIAFDSLRI